MIVVLTGNAHNRLTADPRSDINHKPMGFHLRDQFPELNILSLDITHSGGTAWVCTPECGVLRIGGSESMMGVQFSDADPEYNGQLHVGSINAALPAKDR